MNIDDAHVTQLKGMVAVAKGRPSWIQPNPDTRSDQPTPEERTHEVQRFILFDLPIALLYLKPGQSLPLLRLFDTDVDRSGSSRLGLGAQDLVRTQNRSLLVGPVKALVMLLEELGLTIVFQKGYLCISLPDE